MMDFRGLNLFILSKNMNFTSGDNRFVLFFKCHGSDIRDRVASDYRYRASLHDVSDESREIKNDRSYAVMLNIAKKHYAELVKNLTEFEGK